MDENWKRRQEAYRLEQQKCSLLFRIITANALHEGLQGMESEDCVVDFINKKLRKGLGDRAWTEAEVEKIKRDAATHAKRCAIRLTRKCRKVIPICGED